MCSRSPFSLFTSDPGRRVAAGVHLTKGPMPNQTPSDEFAKREAIIHLMLELSGKIDVLYEDDRSDPVVSTAKILADSIVAKMAAAWPNP